ncbi:MAG: transcriptional regulator PpsR [Paracoccaceae bacterium]|nr:MAG: transcriptional regulator PpsR [Paracoccaceae bacterium]
MLSGGSIPMLAPDLLAEVISTASDIALHVTRDGAVISVLVNEHHRSFGQLETWVGRQVRELLTPESVQKLDRRLTQLHEAPEGTSLAVEITHEDAVNAGFPVRYALHRLPGDESVLMLGRDMRAIAEIQQKLVSVQLALEKDYEAQREIDTRYRVLMEMTRDAILLVSMATGRIADLNQVAANLLGGTRNELLGAAVAQEFVGRRRGELLETMASLATADAATPIEMQARRSQKRVMMVPLVFRAAGERLLLCRLDVVEQVRPAADELGDALGRLYAEGVDGIVFADRDGLIRGANESFLNMTDSSGLAAVRGRSLADFLLRGAVDLKVLIENAKRTGRMRMYATRLVTMFQAQVAVEISATWLNDRPQPVLALVVRDASRAEAMRRSGLGGTEDGSSSVVELVGSAKLKDIVAETADVVERMCIETAVELTRNNRVAAAEMLGLSRQSLYVKLRKYGLLSKGEE